MTLTLAVAGAGLVVWLVVVVGHHRLHHHDPWRALARADRHKAARSP